MFLALLTLSSYFCVVPCVTLLMAPTSQYVNITYNATFICNATGYQVSYNWTIGTGSFPNKVTDVNSNVLVIPDVRSSDENQYCCNYSNVKCANQICANLTVKGMYSMQLHNMYIRSIRYLLYSTHLLLTHIGLPKVRIHAVPHSEIFIGGNVKLVANASGFGLEKFIYKWIHQNGKIIKNNTLKIMSVKQGDEGTYTCIVENEYGDKAEDNITLEVISKLFVNLSLLDYNEKVC